MGKWRWHFPHSRAFSPEWVGKENKPSNIRLKREQVTKHPEGWQTYMKSMCHLTMHATCNAASLDQLGAEIAHEKL